SPIPGTILYEWEIKHGEKIHYPSSIEEWANYKFDKVGEIDAFKPWTREAHLMSLEGYRDRRYIKLMTFYLWICCLNPKVKFKMRHSKLKIMWLLLNKLSSLRINCGFFGVPIEMWIYDFLRMSKIIIFKKVLKK
ncbi:MAG: hypothetical protein AB1567_13100, partial [bacterium]